MAARGTTSSALARILHMLSLHPDVQRRMREEVLAARACCDGGSDLSYDDLMALPYFDAVVKETLRLCAMSPVYLAAAPSY